MAKAQNSEELLSLEKLISLSESTNGSSLEKLLKKSPCPKVSCAIKRKRLRIEKGINPSGDTLAYENREGALILSFRISEPLFEMLDEFLNYINNLDYVELEDARRSDLPDGSSLFRFRIVAV